MHLLGIAPAGQANPNPNPNPNPDPNPNRNPSPHQVHSEAVRFGQSLGCRAAVVYGGVPKHTQAALPEP